MMDHICLYVIKYEDKYVTMYNYIYNWPHIELYLTQYWRNFAIYNYMQNTICIHILLDLKLYMRYH